MNFDKNIFSQAQTLFTQEEFNKALNEAKTEIMAIAIHATKQAMFLEREACAELLMKLADKEDEGELCTALRDAASDILNRLPPPLQ